MSFGRSDGPADPAESDRLLDAARAGRDPGPDADPLARLLAAASAPAGPGELSGEEQALAAFRAARAHPAPAAASAPRRRLRVGVAAWVAGLAATATAGVAFAAVRIDRSEQPAPPPAPTSAASSGPAGSRTPGPSADPTAATGTPAPTASPGQTGGPGRPAKVQQLTGLCRAYLAKSDRQRARALETPAYADLVAAAGGAGQVEAYCLRLVPPAGKPTEPHERVTPSGPAGTAPTPAHPTGRPKTDD
ncbi:hypothetical protein [Micromonospora auratinigra]|uniref:Uncharacterized protein n=1 Tax=Micromonospora auratinigra TaxID=261654 RepID=A0A1A8Z7P4_9ACTN|nr:hypothetical protein [Micromonospora auratinigra]SBT39961.1 hypothetical protein GA0070611_1088 [Micromonospora auratinigra]